MIGNMDYARVVSRKKLRETGLTTDDIAAGQLVMVVGSRWAQWHKNLPYDHRFFVRVIKVVGGEHQFSNVYEVFAGSLEKVEDEETIKILRKKLGYWE